MRPILIAGLLLIVIPLTGCAVNPYTQFYVNQLNGQPVSAVPSLIPSTGDPEVRVGRDPKDDELQMIEDGFQLIGYASFVGPPQDVALAKMRGRQLKAAVVLTYSSNPQTATETMPVLDLSGVADVLNPKTETTKTGGTVYGAGGSVSYTETSTKTVPREKAAPQTTTYTTTRYDQVATFWVKAQPPRLGVWPRDLTAEERAARGTNKGIAILVVSKGSPAYAADLFRGDIILRIGDVPLMRSEDLVPALDRYAGTEVDILLVRGDKEKTIRVKLNPTR